MPGPFKSVTALYVSYVLHGENEGWKTRYRAKSFGLIFSVNMYNVSYVISKEKAFLKCMENILPSVEQLTLFCITNQHTAVLF